MQSNDIPRLISDIKLFSKINAKSNFEAKNQFFNIMRKPHNYSD